MWLIAEHTDADLLLYICAYDDTLSNSWPVWEGSRCHIETGGGAQCASKFPVPPLFEVCGTSLLLLLIALQLALLIVLARSLQ
jgi:hypothetical protein